MADDFCHSPKTFTGNLTRENTLIEMSFSLNGICDFPKNNFEANVCAVNFCDFPRERVPQQIKHKVSANCLEQVTKDWMSYETFAVILTTKHQSHISI